MRFRLFAISVILNWAALTHSVQAELQTALAKANAEVDKWRNKCETDVIQRTGELEEAKKILATKLQEAKEHAEATQAQCANLERTKNRLQGELRNLTINLERCNGVGANFREVAAESEQREKESQVQAKGLSTELSKLKIFSEQILEQLETAREETKNLQKKTAEILDHCADI